MKIKGFPSDSRSFREKKLIIIKALLRNIDKREIMELFDLPPRPLAFASEIQLNPRGRRLPLDPEDGEVELEIRDIPGSGRGLISRTFIKAGTVVIKERAAVLGPKQTSDFVCVECCKTLTSLEGKSENTDVVPCQKCGAPLCIGCRIAMDEFERNGAPNQKEDNISSRFRHREECEIFRNAGQFFEISDLKSSRQIYCILSVLRFLLESERNPDLWKLNDNFEDRKRTMMFCFNQVKVVKYLHSQLQLKDRFTNEEIQRASSCLDTNCYEASNGESKARGLFQDISLLNHDCSPNCWKFFDDQLNMTVITSKDIEAGEELTLNYVPILQATPVRRLLLSQTKQFSCRCKRCHDPTEFGTELSTMVCRQCKKAEIRPVEAEENEENSNENDQEEFVMKCFGCGVIMPKEMCHMMLDTAMQFIGASSSNGDHKDNEEKGDSMTSDVLQRINSSIEHLSRFLGPNHYLIIDLKMKFISEASELATHQPLGTEEQPLEGPLSEEDKNMAIEYCKQVLDILAKIHPGVNQVQMSILKSYERFIGDSDEKIHKFITKLVKKKNVFISKYGELAIFG